MDMLCCLTEEYSVLVDTEELIGTTEHVVIDEVTHK